jgi:16S rRNA (cytosine967-C5)-methyltransferase
MTHPSGTKAGKSAPKNRPTEISPARKAAFNILEAVDRGHSHSDDLLRGKAVKALSAQDRNLATALVLGVLRWQIRLDHQLQPLLKRPNARLDSEVQIALRLGAFQILHMDRIPARAAIDESVELAKQAGQRFASGMVNAVLRKLALLPREESAGASSPDLEAAEAFPQWMVERWTSFYGLAAARAICLHGQNQPPLTIRMATGASEAELAEDALAVFPGPLLSAARTVISGDAAASTSFQEGRIRMQDEGSQLVAEVAAASVPEGKVNILDACAAPGGKTLILAERNPQAHIVACESSAPRFDQLRHRLASYAAQIECRHADATTLNDDAAFDLVLADVPCSGTGTLGRNPEIRHRLKPEEFARQSERQRALFAAALRAVRPGGKVVYSTCSLEPEENEQVVAAVLAATPGARSVSLRPTIEALQFGSILAPGAAGQLLAAMTQQGALRLLPGTFDTDGFFIALLERIA